MGTILVYAAIAIAVAAALVALLVLVLPEERMSRPTRDVVPLGLPIDREVGADDISRVRLPVGVRGYRMADTDAVLDRLSAEIERRDREIAELRMAHDRASSQPVAYAGPQAAGGNELEGDVDLDVDLELGSPVPDVDAPSAEYRQEPGAGAHRV